MLHREGSYLLSLTKTSDTWINWKLYEVITEDDDEKPMMWVNGKRNGQLGRDLTVNPDEAHAFAEGSVKWDGCLELSFVEGCHLCDRQCGEAFTKALLAVWDQAAKMLPHWEGS